MARRDRITGRVAKQIGAMAIVEACEVKAPASAASGGRFAIGGERIGAHRTIKVAFVDQTGNEVGGAEESLALLLTHLPPDISPLVILFEEGVFAKRLRNAGFAVEILPIAGVINNATRNRFALSSLRVVPGALATLVALLRSHEVDVVHTNTVKAHFLGCIAARLARIPCVVHLRDILGGVGRVALRASVVAGSNRRIAISSVVAACYGLSHTEVIANPLDLATYEVLPDRSWARARLSLPEDAPIFAIVGRVNRWKGHGKFLRSAARASLDTNIRFAVVGEPRFGDSGYVSELQAMAKDLEIGDRVHFLPWQAEIKTVYAAIDVLVNCSEREPFGRTVIEAAAAGIPTICFDDAGVAEFMLRSGIGSVVPAGDERALADAMIRLSRDEAALAESGKSARSWATEFDARTHARKVGNVLRGVA